MAKRLFLLLFLGLFNIAMIPESLMATDEVILTGLNSDKIYETVYNESVLEETHEEVAYADVVEEVAVYDEPEYYSEPEYAVPSNSIAVAGRIIDIVDVDNTAVDAGDHVNKYGDKFLYGHNSNHVFGVLSGVGVGNIFTIVYDGISTNYQVKEVVLYEKTSATTLGLNGVTYKMGAIVNGRGKYDMVLMTCAGESYGNGDASHRLVIYADAV